MNEKAVSEPVRTDRPQVRWLANYAILEPYDYVDLFKAPDTPRGRNPYSSTTPPVSSDR